ncbi:winged helix-turn-helix transcriptional regulator [Leptolinea tardivitalis]|uniref:winged helix-turn-helix transcriptional regulator n=1 Tax=Leptolinea tardivitalis TaxID=229920 RepID=UPI0007841578|nr:winged helix-turn-helix transcriptional regulator [Leptolinea tardivitalis]GAP19953.1 transcriptional regulator [Leptolinea tardivitalis]
MGLNPDSARDLILLEHIEQNPDATQASLAAQVGVAVGTVNWHLKRLVAKGYVKVRHAERRKLRYIITPDGIALRANLTVDYIQNSFRLYRLVRERMETTLQQVRQAGYDQVTLTGDGDVADVCRLTCAEQNIKILESGQVPHLTINGLKIFTEWPDGKDPSSSNISDSIRIEHLEGDSQTK